jgi:hypothetical protein
MAKHHYALVSSDGSILRTTEPLDTAPAHVNNCVWQQVYETGPAHNPDIHEAHSHKFEWDGHRVVRRFQIRRKA